MIFNTILSIIFIGGYMIYLYDQFGNKIDITDYKYLDRGRCGEVYKKDEELLKLYYYDCKYRFIIGKKIFNMIKEINSPNIVELKDYYYKKNTHFHPEIDAYTMNYIHRGNISLLTSSQEYIYKVLDQLLDVARTLSEKNICIFDAKNSNIIFNKRGAKIIDVDLFRFFKLLSKDTIYKRNVYEVYQYLSSKLEHDIKKDNNNEQYHKVKRLIKKECHVIDNNY